MHNLLLRFSHYIICELFFDISFGLYCNFLDPVQQSESVQALMVVDRGGRYNTYYIGPAMPFQCISNDTCKF